MGNGGERCRATADFCHFSDKFSSTPGPTINTCGLRNKLKMKNWRLQILNMPSRNVVMQVYIECSKRLLIV